MHDKKDIYEHLQKVLVDLFEVPAEAISPEALLVEDLDIDSIDAVDIAVEMQELTGRKIHPEEFKEIERVQDVVDAVFRLANAESA
ncbi:MAG: acyl carrier protein [Halioglobus sp.]|nr:acyl carrier protein [Halioglobus sp.]